ncbi:endo-N-acetyl-beta-D-glucosaminidase precursor [Pterulicium gracile]|uniref:Endo-N-acetyl-beta-D-glucosaminidase n=1 Tax=Pterulicium gracile TaxID=1884261 RepID=A0A5C3Q5H9_9AGAR|nr:endo-N-acetyl-beta-D-glucosaminidase precursor [Pterula gracilis]
MKLFVLRFLLFSVITVPSLARPLSDYHGGQLANNATTLPIETAPTDLPRLAIYYQTTHTQATGGDPISILPLIAEKGIALTHIYICTFHVRYNDVIHLNDFPPDNARFTTLWQEVEVLRNSGIKVMGMVGGASAGSFTTRTLDAPEGDTNFEKHYLQLRDVLRRYNLQGLDIDVEQRMSLNGMLRLVRRLRSDFGPDFIITQAPVGTALMPSGSPNLSGFPYRQLEDTVGGDIAYYNAQLYNGFGTLFDTRSFDSVVSAGYDPKKIVAGQITTPANGGSFVPFEQLKATMNALVQKYGQIGGIMGWEYFNGMPGGTSEPWEWAQQITLILRPNFPARLIVTEGDARKLDEAWEVSVGGDGASVAEGEGKPDYRAMINA